MLRYPLLGLTAIVVVLLSFTGTSHAAAALHGDGGSWWDLLMPVYQAFSGGEYWYAGSIALVGAVAMAKHYGGDKAPWLHTDFGAAGLTFVAAFAGSCTASLSGGAVMTGDVALTAAKLAVGAVGGYTAIKHLVVTPLLPYVAKLPAWAQRAARTVLWLFDGKPVAPSAPPSEPAANTPASPSV